MTKQRGNSEWVAGISLCVFFPMLVNLVVLATYLMAD